MENTTTGITPLLSLRGIAKAFGNQRILDGVSFDVYPGKITALVGDNGAGKSTLVKIITGYYPPDAGTIFFQGNPVRFSGSHGTTAARSLGIEVVHQQPAFLNNLPIWRNFFAGRELVRGMPPFRRLDIPGMRQLTRDMLAEFGLRESVDPDKPAGQLSGGERQIVAISKARWFHSKLLLLDEPTSALSDIQADRVLDVIRQVAGSGTGILMITHRPDQIRAIADQVVVLHQGKPDKRKDFA